MGKSYSWIVPLVLGVLAAILYWAALRAGTKPIVLVGVKENVRAGVDLTDDVLVAVNVRADKSLLRSTIKWEDRGLVIGRRVSRSLVEGELVLFSDVRQAPGNVAQNLLAGEGSLTVTVPQNRIVPGLRIGDSVVVLVLRDTGDVEPPPDKKGRATPPGERLVGPFRLIGLSERAEGPAAGSDARQLVVAIKVDGSGPADRSGKELAEAIRGARGERVLAVEVPGPVR